MDFRKLIRIIEAEEEYYQIPLPAKRDDFKPVFSEETMDIHYGTLYKKYVEAAKSGDASDFQLAGAYLHTILFEQIQIPATSNNPIGISKSFIEDYFGSYENLKKAVEEAALDLTGSGWIYVDTKGSIKTIEKHKIVSNIVILIDMWEHAFLIDYGADKKKYLKELWKTINWDIINTRLNHS
jgi:Fe-Mn family superoxide dismutase